MKCSKCKRSATGMVAVRDSMNMVPSDVEFASESHEMIIEWDFRCSEHRS